VCAARRAGGDRDSARRPRGLKPPPPPRARVVSPRCDAAAARPRHAREEKTREPEDRGIEKRLGKRERPVGGWFASRALARGAGDRADRRAPEERGAAARRRAAVIAVTVRVDEQAE